MNNISMVVLMRLNHDDSRMVIYGVEKRGGAVLVLVDFSNDSLLATVSYRHKPVWIVKAVCF